ncbi:hypothetical protein [Miltoncostaea oceani]|uniref:hypothetical protein n=1 Tax=Miltoncostaea oceani TaxID=2843216 RepID=UPI001C3C2193|nr:hypothetical protein [Miltoncostaea oceani]
MNDATQTTASWTWETAEGSRLGVSDDRSSAERICRGLAVEGWSGGPQLIVLRDGEGRVLCRYLPDGRVDVVHDPVLESALGSSSAQEGGAAVIEANRQHRVSRTLRAAGLPADHLFRPIFVAIDAAGAIITWDEDPARVVGTEGRGGVVWRTDSGSDISGRLRTITA